MGNDARPLDAMLAGAGPALGAWLVSASEAVTEAMALAGWDFLVLDLEHAPITPQTVGQHLRAAAVSGVPVIVRMADQAPAAIKQVLDAGATALMFPFVEDAAQAAALVGLTRYPPRGTRGLARMIRASGYGTRADYAARADEGINVIAQLETPAALARLETVAAVPGIDAVFIGPGDISAALGRAGDVSHPEVMEALLAGFRTAHALGKPAGTILPSPELIQRAVAAGCRFAAAATDMGLMMAGSRQTLNALR